MNASSKARDIKMEIRHLLEPQRAMIACSAHGVVVINWTYPLCFIAPSMPESDATKCGTRAIIYHQRMQ